MKNLKYLLIAGILMIVTQSCKKNFLDVKQEGVQTYDSYFASGEQVESLVNGIYNVLQWDKVHGQLDWVYGDVMSDDTEKGGENDADQPLMRQMEIYTHNSGNGYISETWANLYTGIFRANMVLGRIDEVPEDVFAKGWKERLRAESKFLRAYFYFRLNIMWGGVPLITTILTPDEFEQARASKEEIWAQIEKDLTEAIPYLPKKSGSDPSKNYDETKDLGRATEGAARALLCKVHLFQKEWAEAKVQADAIIGSGEYDLLPLDGVTTNFDNIFDLEHENCIESVFEIQCGGKGYTYEYLYGWGNGDLGTLMNVYWLSRAHGGWGFNCPTQDLFKEYESGDVRRKYTIAKHGDALLYGIAGYNTKASTTGFLPRKYIVSSDIITQAPSLSQGPSNFRVFRYADVLLMHAEACAELGLNTDAQTSLMKIRNRVGITTMASDVKYPTMIDKVRHERRVELALEGQRFFDLVRWGLADAELGPLGYTSKNAVFPIPEGEIQLSGGKIEQNSGY